MIDVITIETPSLGDRSYLAHDGTAALVVDPQRDIDRVLHIVDSLGVTITHVLETHVHNDYVTGGFALAQATGAAYHVAAAEELAIDHVPTSAGDVVRIGSMEVLALATPGHTPNHLAYAIGMAGSTEAVFTGGSLLFGAVGRTDLIGPHLTDELTRAQYKSVRRLVRELPGEAVVHPTHGFGSFCAATETSGDTSTIAEQRAQNVALQQDDEDEFVRTLIAGLAAYPSYYARMGATNRSGPTAPDLDPPSPVDPDELRRRIDKGEWVVDMRNRRAFARSHLSGTISVELGDAFSTYLGWTMRWGMPLTLVGENVEQVSQAVRQLVRIGIDDLAGMATGPPEVLAVDGATASYRVAGFAELAKERSGGIVVLDVRRPDEWEAGHIVGATHIPFYELEERMEEVPPGEVWVHCASGFRSAIAASLVDRAGRTAVQIDDDWSNAAGEDLDIES